MDNNLDKLYHNSFNSAKIKFHNELDRINKINIPQHFKLIKMLSIRQSYNNYIRQLKFNLMYNKNKNKNDQYISIMNKYNKKALLFGLNYIGTAYELYGCINDTDNIKNILQTKFAYNYFNILTDKTNKKPTRKNIIDELTNMLVYSKSGDNLFFLYSGHGTCTYDLNKDELDRQDELIVPLDARNIKTCILDDEIKKIITNNLKKGVKLFMLFDSCFSGTIVDLKYNYLVNDTNVNNMTVNNMTVNNMNSETKGQVIAISGCKDNQTSADAYVSYLNKNIYSGAMTYAFLKTIQELGTNITLSNLLINMRSILVKEGYEQIPQLSSGTNIDINMLIPF